MSSVGPSAQGFGEVAFPTDSVAVNCLLYGPGSKEDRKGLKPPSPLQWHTLSDLRIAHGS